MFNRQPNNSLEVNLAQIQVSLKTIIQNTSANSHEIASIKHALYSDKDSLIVKMNQLSQQLEQLVEFNRKNEKRLDLSEQSTDEINREIIEIKNSVKKLDERADDHKKFSQMIAGILAAFVIPATLTFAFNLITKHERTTSPAARLVPEGQNIYTVAEVPRAI